MKITEINGKLISDKYYSINHPSGLEIFIYPREHSSSTYAMFGTKYGSVDSCFKRSDEDRAEAVPEGIAHFLEHKLFESEDGDAFERFAETGASANAFTSFESTCYLYASTDKVYESLEILLDFVQSPYFTEETVKKEQGIIGQEIKMYEDDPNWKLFFNHIRALYHNHPIRDDIAGTVESIANITPELLYRCYNTFYNLHNMALSIVGNVDVERVLEVCDRTLKPAEPVSVERVIPAEPKTVVTDYVEQKMQVSFPMFQFGYKEAVEKENLSERDIAAMEVLLDLMASDASPMFRTLLDEGLVNEASFSYEYFEGSGYASVFFSGESKDPKRVAEFIAQEVERLKAEGIDQAAFERSRRAVYGENVSAMNSVSAIANGIMNRVFKNRELFTYIDVFSELTLEDVTEKLSRVFDRDRSVLSVILPL